MDTFNLRPNLERLEDRTTPASVADLYWTAEYLGRMAEDMEWMSHPSARSWVQGYFTGLYQDMAATLPTLTDPGAIGIANMIANFSVSVGNVVGFSVVPPPAPVPPPPGDLGMVNTLPDLNSSSWVNQQNGLKTWDVKVGEGDPVAAGDKIDIFYTGWLTNGTVFDSRRSPQGPINFDLDNLIEGWKQGIPGMKPGGIRRLYIPAALGYGSTERPGIPANSDLVFEIKVISHE